MTGARRLDHRSGSELDADDGPWSAAARLGARQHGAIARRQLRAVGLTNRQIDRALRTGHLHSVHRGVFALGHPRLTTMGRWAAASLASGPRSAVGYRSAAALWALRPSSASTTEIVVASTSRPAHRDVVVRCHPALLRDEVTRCEGLPVTTVARTLLDLAAVVSRRQLRRAIAQAETLQLFDLWTVNRLLERHPRHRGSSGIRDVLASWVQPVRARSPLEDGFPDLCKRWGLPRPIMNGTVLGLEIDALFPDHGVAVELDGRRYHSGVIRWEDDHERRARMVGAGWTFLAYTYRQVTEDDGRFVHATLAPALRRGIVAHGARAGARSAAQPPSPSSSPPQR